MNFILDPKFFSYIIMTLYALNCLRWLYERDMGQVIYWGAAFAITYSVNFMIGKT